MPPSLHTPVKGFLLSLLVCSLLQISIFASIIHRGDAGGELLECLLPPCQRAYPLWIAIVLFSGMAGLAARKMVTVVRYYPPNDDDDDDKTTAAGSNNHLTRTDTDDDALLVASMGVAILNVAMDVHYAHPIPHAGTSLNMLMHSHVSYDSQAVLPFLSVFLSICTMAIAIISHRALTDLCSNSTTSSAKKVR